MLIDANTASFTSFLSALESRLLNRFDIQKYAREAYNIGIRYIGACCGMEPYHVRAIAEEVSNIYDPPPPRGFREQGNMAINVMGTWEQKHTLGNSEHQN